MRYIDVVMYVGCVQLAQVAVQASLCRDIFQRMAAATAVTAIFAIIPRNLSAAAVLEYTCFGTPYTKIAGE